MESNTYGLMEHPQRPYPLGTQTFSIMMEQGLVYVDKTEQVYSMTHSPSRYVFLSRPRRFGKSLLVSTLHSYFEGRKELFKGLAIDSLETEWTEYPVLHFDMSTAKNMSCERLESELDLQLLKYEQLYGKVEKERYSNQRLQGLIKRACEQTGRQVVVLIDEYDAPLLDVVHEEENLSALRNVMRNFYSPLKACDPYLRFVFLTGITKFSQMSIFSEFNNIRNISMLPEYAAICGITEDELRAQMAVDIDILAQRMEVTPQEAFHALKDNYDGYHFTWPSPDIYNPYSLLNAFADGMIKPYWFGSGTPTYLIEMLRKFGVKPESIGQRKAMASAFDAPTERMTTITPLLYQSGYITIKDYNKRREQYTLDIPNKEVRIGLMHSLLPEYVTEPKAEEAQNVVIALCDAIDDHDMDKALGLLQTFLSTIPYCPDTDHEGHYQSLLYTIFSLIGYYLDVEVRTSAGRVDMVMRTADTLYLVELKLNRSAEAAMRQIDLKAYADRFALCGLPVVKVAINFDQSTRTLSDWRIS